MSDPSVSIIVPISSADAGLTDTLASAVQQSFSATEVIAVACPDVWGEFAADQFTGHRIRHCAALPGTNEAGLLQLGLTVATGRFIAWLVPGDQYDPRKIERQIAALQQLPEAGVATCGLHSRTSVALTCDTDVQQPSTTLGLATTLVLGRTDARTLLVERSCLEAIGGFDSTFEFLHLVDLAVRLSGRFRFADVPFPLVTVSRSLPDSREERGRICSSVLKTLSIGTPVTEFAQLAVFAGRAAGFNSPEANRVIEAAISPKVLSIAVSRGDDSKVPDLAAIAATAGVPLAECIELDTAGEPSSLLMSALERTTGRYLVVLDSSAQLRPDIVRTQLLCSVANNLDACFPWPDPLVLEPGLPDLPLTGTLFRRVAVEEVTRPLFHNNWRFWMEFSRKGRVGAMPAVDIIPGREIPAIPQRAELSSVDLARAVVDGAWYRKMYPDVAAAGIDPAAHYLECGWREGRHPNQWFHTAWYLDQHQNLNPDICPLLHFVTEGKGAYPWSRPHFDVRFNVWRQLGTKAQAGDSLLDVFVPGLRDLSTRLHLDSDAMWRIVEARLPSLLYSMRKLQAGELEIFRQLVDFIDSEWYAERYSRIGATDAVEHYVCFGWRDGWDPNPWFDSAWYISQNPEAAQSHSSPLEHFVREGADSGKSPHPGFHTEWYVSRYLPPGTPAGPQILLHFLTEGARNGNLPHPRLDRKLIHEELALVPGSTRSVHLAELYRKLPDERLTLAGLIDEEWYRAATTQAMEMDVDRVSHYLQHGGSEYSQPNAWFHPRWYLDQNPSATESGLAPLVHFVRIGAYEGMRPSPGFDPVWYGERYLGALTPTADALHHFLTSGIWDGAVPGAYLDRPEVLNTIALTPVHERPSFLRRLSDSVREQESLASALVDEPWYRARYDVTGTTALADYRERGWRTGRDPNAWFDTAWYLQRNRDIRALEISPLDHFISTGAAEGRDPHPLFRIAWYARFYLGSSSRRAEALLHFMTIGLDNGNVPDPRLATPSVQNRLLTVEKSGRPTLIHRLIEQLSRTQVGGVLWTSTDADLWPILLTRNFPVSTLGVLLLLDATSPDDFLAAKGAAKALPPEEVPLFGIVENESSLRIADRLGQGAVSVVFALPGQLPGLQMLLRQVPCRRAAVLSSHLANSAAVRAVRNADVPVFSREIEDPLISA